MTQAQSTLPAPMPAMIHCVGPAYTMFAEAAVHVRNGMIFHPDRIVEFFPNNGNVSFYLVQGNPTQAAIDMAKAANEHALQRQQADYEADVKRAAQAIIEQEKREALEKQVAAAVAEHEKAIKKLKAANEAELNLLQQATAAELAKLKK